MLRYLILLLIFILPLTASATAQEPDTIVINNQLLPLNTNPLDKHIKVVGWEPPEEASIWSSNWRGYIAKWEIEAGNLILKEASILLKGGTFKNQKRQSIVGELFPKNKKVIAIWYSGALIVPDGEMTNYIHMGYGSSYESYQVLRIHKGIVIEHLTFTSQQFEIYKERKFQNFKETKKFQEELSQFTTGEDQWTEEDALDYMQSAYAEYYLSI
tara:strand:+ start:621 stop:1262 length:642 start_codon:yes stop_codon:yes gene_type:complete